MTARLALRLLRRDWRAGELRVLALALVVTVASVTSVGFFVDRVRQALERQATELLGADIAIVSDHAVAGPLASPPQDLRRAATVEFPSMVIAGERSRLAEIEAVEVGYPLRGALQVSDAPFAPSRAARGVPAPGTVWVEARLLSQLGIAVGDGVQLGEQRFIVAAVLTAEPARIAGSLFSIAPRLMLNSTDLPATALLQPASRARYRMLYAGEPEEIRAFRAFAAQRLGAGERLEDIEGARPEVRGALERARRFLGLAAVVSVMLAGVAVAMTARRFVLRQLDACAVLRCLGARRVQVLVIFLYQLLALALGAAVLGCAAGYLGQQALVGALGALAGFALPPPSAAPLLSGLLVVFATALGFALPPLLHVRDVPALRVLRRELGALPASGRMVYLSGAAALAALVLWQSGDRELGGYLLAGTGAGLAALAGAAALLIGMLRRLGRRLRGAWRLGVHAITRRAGTAVVQVLAFGLGITAMLLLTLVRGDLLRDWQASLPEGAPNRFLINVQPEQVGALREFFAVRGADAPRLFPMVRGRLTAIAGRAVSPESYADERAGHLVAREFNLSWAAELQDDNRLVSGAWWGAADRERRIVSVEEGLARTLGIRQDDLLRFNVAGSELEVRVASLRRVEWDTFRVNFFVLAPPGVLDGYPASYITSLYVPEAEHRLLDELVRAFPSVTVIDVAAVMGQVRQVISQVSAAVQYVFAFTLLAGVLVMYAAIHATLDERIRESVLLRMLGAARARMLGGLLVEFVGLGALAGLVAACAAALIGYVVAEQVFQFAYTLNPWLWPAGMIVGGAGVGLAGFLGTRFVLRYPPLRALRSGV